MLGLWIDGLSDSERDRIITHPDPTFRGGWWWDSDRQCGCLVAQVVGRDVMIELELGKLVVGQVAAFSLTVGQRFPRLTRRFGAERIWRACKLRAAKRNRVELVQPRPRKRARLAARTS